MSRTLTAAILAVALAPGLGCLQYNDQCRPLVADPDSIVGYLADDVFLEKPYTRHANHVLGQLAADAFRHAADRTPAPAELGVVNGGSLRAEGLCVTRTVIPKGPLENGLLHEVLLFENAVVTVDLTEQQLVDMFEHSVEALFPEGQPIVSPDGAFLHVSKGTTVHVDCERPRGRRVVALTVNERTVPLPPRVDPSIRYRVAMADFLLQGGDGYGAIFKDAATDLSRNPVTASTEDGSRATDTNLTEAYMRVNHPTGEQALAEEARVVFIHCARPGRPVGQ